MKIAICAIIKNENLYLREWVEYHKRLGFDKIILYDNNPVDGEVPHQVIGDYVMDGYVDVHNIRGVPWSYRGVEGEQQRVQERSYTRCIKTYRNEYKWIAFIDVDEFICFGKDESRNIHDIFEKYGYDSKGFENVLMSWYVIGSDGETSYENYPVRMRFHNHVEIRDPKYGISDLWVKSIVRTDALNDGAFMGCHVLPKSYCCNEQAYFVPGENEGYGSPQQIPFPSYDVIYVKHYVTKSLWEHLSKMRHLKNGFWVQDNRMETYKMINGWSEESEKILQKFQEYLNNSEE